MDEKQINKLVLRLLILAAAIFLLWHLQFVFIILLISFMLTVILLPFVRLLHKAHIPAFFAVFLPLSILVALLSFLIIGVAPALREQSIQLAENLPEYAAQLPFGDRLDFDAARNWITQRLSDIDVGQVAINVSTAVLRGFFALITILVITIYWLTDYSRIKLTLLSYLPRKQQDRGEDVWHRIETKLGKWFLGQIMVSTTVGIVTWIAMMLLGVPYAAVLGVLAGLLEIVPSVGPIVAALPAIVIGLSDSPEKALLIAAVYIVIQQVESHVVTPVLMGRRVHLHPLAIITAFLMGGVAFGLLGALLSVPLAIMVSAVVDSFRDKQAGRKQSVDHKSPSS